LLYLCLDVPPDTSKAARALCNVYSDATRNALKFEAASRSRLGGCRVECSARRLSRCRRRLHQLMTTTIRPASDLPISAPPTRQTLVRTGATSVTSPKRLARIAGVLYLFVAIFGGFA